MHVLILGAAGETGSRLTREALRRGHDVSALARDPAKLTARLGEDAARVEIITTDVGDEGALAHAMTGKSAVINAAGNAWDGANFAPLVQRTIKVAARTMGPGGRFWLFGGAALLHIPGTRLMGIDLPGVPAVYRAHRENYEIVRVTELDWSMLCPGPMIAAPSGHAHEGLRLSAETWPFPAPPLARWLPRPALTLAFAGHRGEITITYEDAAKVVLDHLSANGPFSRKRVGVALPVGVKLSKPGGGARGNA